MKWTSWCNLILGIWLIIATWAVGFMTTATATNSFIIGVIVIAAALAALSSLAAARGARWVNLIAGIWLIVSPWVLRFGTNVNVIANDVIVGVLIAVFAWIGLGTMRRVTAA